MQPVSDLFRSKRAPTRKPPNVEALNLVDVGAGGETVLDTQGAWRETVRRAFEVFPSRSPYSPLLSLRPVGG